MTNVERVMAIISSSINKEYKKITLATSFCKPYKQHRYTVKKRNFTKSAYMIIIYLTYRIIIIICEHACAYESIHLIIQYHIGD